MTDGQGFYRHGLRRMAGRDVHERHRTASPLELFFDLTFVTAFGVAGAELAHGIAGGHPGSATVAFVIAMLVIVWAWTSYPWFASAFDNDDWLFRVLTLVQMTGVIIVAIGIPVLFASLEEGQHFEGRVMVAGYVVMRVAVIAQWLRVAVDDGRFRRLALTNVVAVGVAQCGWIAFILRGAGRPTRSSSSARASWCRSRCGGPTSCSRPRRSSPCAGARSSRERTATWCSSRPSAPVCT